MREIIKKVAVIIFIGTVISSLSGTLLIMIYKAYPSEKEIQQIQENHVRAIKLCLDNDLEAYQIGGGRWFCKPKE